MAFTQDTFAPVGPQSTDAPSVYSYRTNDTVSDLVQSGYFTPKQYQLEEGDLVMASVNDANTFSIFQVTSDTSSVINVSDEYVDGVTQDYIPIKDGGGFVDSPLRLEGGTLISSVSIQSPPASFKIGVNETITSAGSGVGYSLTAQGSTFEIPGSLYSEAAGTLVGLGVSDYSAPAFDLPTQASDVVTNSYEDYVWEAQIFSKEQDPINGVDEDLFRVYRVTVRGDTGPQAPTRVRLYIEDPDLNPNAVPFFDNIASREPEWEAGSAGFVISETGDSVLDFGEGQRLRVGVKFWIRYTVPAGQQFTIKGDNVDIGFGTVFVPYQVSRVMPGYEIDVAPPRDRGTLQTTDATWTTIITHSVATDKTENVTFNAYAEENGGSRRFSAELIATAYNNAGTVTEIGDTIIYRHRPTSVANIRVQASGSDLLLQVRGTGGDTWDWRGIAQTRAQEL